MFAHQKERKQQKKTQPFGMWLFRGEQHTYCSWLNRNVEEAVGSTAEKGLVVAGLGFSTHTTCLLGFSSLKIVSPSHLRAYRSYPTSRPPPHAKEETKRRNNSYHQFTRKLAVPARVDEPTRVGGPQEAVALHHGKHAHPLSPAPRIWSTTASRKPKTCSREDRTTIVSNLIEPGAER